MVRLNKAPFEVAALIQQVYEAHSYSAAQKGLRYTFSVSHRVPNRVCGDLASIQKALSVITQMAINDSENGSVQINVDLVSSSPSALIVKFSVTDSSRQIPYWFSVSLEAVSSQQTA